VAGFPVSLGFFVRGRMGGMNEKPRRWRPWTELILFAVFCAFGIAYEAQYRSGLGYVIAGMAGSIVIVAAWQLVSAWQSP
jgi:hypothetical protein